MYSARGQTISITGFLNHGFYRPLQFFIKGRWRNVDSLFKIGADQRIGFIKNSDRIQYAMVQEAFIGDLDAIDVIFDQQVVLFEVARCGSYDWPKPVTGSEEFGFVIGPDDTTAGRHIERL